MCAVSATHTDWMELLCIRDYRPLQITQIRTKYTPSKYSLYVKMKANQRAVKAQHRIYCKQKNSVKHE